jgi:hypothetical protein
MYRSTLESTIADLGKAKQKFQRSALMAGGPAGGGRPLEFDKSVDQRQRMANTTDKLRGGTDQLNQAHSQLEETLDVGACSVTWRGARARSWARGAHAGTPPAAAHAARRVQAPAS